MGITACQSCMSIILFTSFFKGLQNCDLVSALVHIQAVERFHKTFVFKQSQRVGSHAKIMKKNEQIDNHKSTNLQNPKTNQIIEKQKVKVLLCHSWTWPSNYSRWSHYKEAQNNENDIVVKHRHHHLHLYSKKKRRPKNYEMGRKPQ
jgi:L-lactate permease